MCLITESPVLPSQAEAEMNYYPREDLDLLDGERCAVLAVEHDILRDHFSLPAKVVTKFFCIYFASSQQWLIHHLCRFGTKYRHRVKHQTPCFWYQFLICMTWRENAVSMRTSSES